MSQLPVFFLVDTSSSMKGEKMLSMNRCIKDCIKSLKLIIKQYGDIDLTIALMKFSTNFYWKTQHGPVNHNNFSFDYFDDNPNEVSNLGNALRELDSKLFDKDFFNLKSDDFMPTIILMTDGEPTDDYIEVLDSNRQDELWEKSTKICFCFGNKSDCKEFSKYIAKRVSLIYGNNQDTFKNSINLNPVTDRILSSMANTSKTYNSEIYRNVSEDYDSNNLKSTLLMLKNEYGCDCFYDTRLIGFISDFAPDLPDFREKKNLIRKLLKNESIKTIIENKDSDLDNQLCVLHKALCSNLDCFELISILASVFEYKVELNTLLSEHDISEISQDKDKFFCDIVAIDGPAGAGKSTVAKKVADKLGYGYLDTGAMYRAVTLKALNEKIDFSDHDALKKCAEESGLRFETRANSSQPHIFLKDVEVTKEIRTPEVSKNVSIVSAVKEVREVMTNLQRKIGNNGKWVVEGRDIGSVVFPKARTKIFMSASIEERAKRRLKDLQEKGFEASIESLKKEITKRDEQDMNRKFTPLIQAKDSIFLDTTSMSIDEVIESIISIVNNNTRYEKSQRKKVWQM